MTTPCSPLPISIDDSRIELGLSGTVNLAHAEIRDMTGIPAGTISLFDTYCLTKDFGTFDITWRNLNGADFNYLPTGPAAPSSTIDWGTGTFVALTTAYPFKYLSVGDLPLKMTGTIPEFRTNGMTGTAAEGRNKILAVTNWGSVGFNSLRYAFWSCSELKNVSGNGGGLVSVTDMSGMFLNSWQMQTLDASTFNTSNVTDMSEMFSGLGQLLTLDVSSFNTSKVTKMWEMFASSDELTTLAVEVFDTSQVTDMNSMFEMCAKLVNCNVTTWDTGKVTRMDRMFWNATALSNISISSFEMTSVTDADLMLFGTAMTTAHYDAALQAWSTQAVQPNVSFGCSSTYTLAASQAARDILTSAPNNWVITDLGGI